MILNELTVDGLLDYRWTCYVFPVDTRWTHADTQARTYSVLGVNSLYTLNGLPVDPLWTLWILACRYLVESRPHTQRRAYNL